MSGYVDKALRAVVLVLVLVGLAAPRAQAQAVPTSVKFENLPDKPIQGQHFIFLSVVNGGVPVTRTSAYLTSALASQTLKVEIANCVCTELVFAWSSMGTPDGPYKLTAETYDASNGTLLASATPVDITIANGLLKGEIGP